ncbi:MAG: T9SS type A sorting domain-containing protein [Bacteroidales bacterium]|nr:T9SS type A sorting domain-containing protein [Bacteroidales bacterium]
MNKILLTFFSLILVLGAFAQHRHDGGMYCSKARFYEEYFKNTKTVNQTPLLHDYDVKHYFIDIEVQNNSVAVSGEVTFYAEVVAEELDTFAFELIDQMNISEVYINDELHSVYRDNDECFVELSEPLSEGEMFYAKVVYGGTPPTGGFFSGITTTYDSWGKNVTWTLSEPFAARDWWPTKQVLEDKADSAWIFLTTAETNMAGSNGLLTNVSTMPDNKLRYEWKTNYKIAYYLLSFAVSEYQEYNIYAHPEGLGDSVLIQNFVYDVPGCLENYQSNIDQTAEFIELFSELFSMYPFAEEKYGHCLTDLGGGMEHQTMTTIGGFNFGLVAHELGHMWFGDNITCETWSDIWINEGFATYSDYLAVEHIQGQSAANSEMNGIHNSVMSQPGGSTYVPEEEVTYDNVWRIFSGRLSYDKGAAILHMIRFELQDDDLFWEVLHTYTELYAGKTATGLEFMEVLNDVSGMDFTQFFDQWYFGEGYPTYSIEWSQDDAYTYLEIHQTTSMPSVTPLFDMLMAYKFSFNDGTDTTVYLQQTDNVNTFMLPISKEIGLIQIDPDNWVLNKVGSITTSIENGNSVRFAFGPNPAGDYLNIDFASEAQSARTITVMNMSGAVIHQINTDQQHLKINTSQLSGGTYLIRAEDLTGQFNARFIKLD